MAIVVNNQSGQAENLDDKLANNALTAGTHSVLLNTPEGDQVTAALQDTPQLLQSGYSHPSPDQYQDILKQQAYTSPSQKAAAFVEGAGSGATFGGFTGLERMMGAKPEDIQNRRKYNPEMRAAGDIAGLVGSALVGTGEARALEAAGEGTAALAAKVGLGKYGQAAVKQATEMALLQGGDEVSKMISHDPEQSVSSALFNTGMSSAAGAVLGLGSEGAKSLWNATVGDKVGQLVSDFKGRIGYHLETPNPVEAITNELGEYHKNITNMADEVYGASGLKAQDIAKSVPVLNDKILEQSVQVNDKLADLIGTMKKKPELFPERLTSKLENDLQAYQGALAAGKQDSGSIFNAIQDLKQTAQGYSKFDKFVKPVDAEYDFVQKMKPFANELKQSLENPEVWGNAAKRQLQINKAFTEFLPALKDFNKKFTSEVAGERVIDPGKINTYLNQIGKPNAELKQEMLSNFLDSSEKYRDTIAKTHENLGLEQPFPTSSLATTRASLQEMTPGAKLADTFVNKGAGTTLGAAVGGAAGSAMGHPVLGSIVGGKALGPLFDSILPAIAKTVLTKEPDAVALKAAIDHGYNVVKGVELLKKASSNVISMSSEVIPNHLIPKARDLEKLDRMVAHVQTAPLSLTKTDDKLAYYMPDQAVQTTATIARSLQYLQTLKPATQAIYPLDPKPQASKAEIAAYNRASMIVEQPLMALKYLQEGSLTTQDLKTLSSTHPALYEGMKSQLTAELIQQKSEGRTIPYKMVPGLSLFLGVPLDASTTPANMQINQAVGPVTKANQQANNEASRPSKSGFKASTSIAQSAAQASEARKTGQKS